MSCPVIQPTSSLGGPEGKGQRSRRGHACNAQSKRKGKGKGKPLADQSSQMHLGPTAPAAFVTMFGGPPMAKGLGKGLYPVGGRYCVHLDVHFRPAAGGAMKTVTACLSDAGVTWLAS